MQTFEIIEYREDLAAAVADMWLRSTEGWNGSVHPASEAAVRQEEASSNHLNLFLARANDEVVGYCKLSEFRNDKGALYIDLLNVRPDWHGHGVGKALVLRALDRTRELGWKRLELFTWPGNLKAVPLYKRCGFQWLRAGLGTQLMNFLPELLATPLLQPWFAELDWYGDNAREILVEPDEQEIGGLALFRYAWKREGGPALEVDVCRRARGIQRIDTPEFSVELKIPGHDLVSGMRHKAVFLLRNKMARPLEVSLTGIEDGPVRCDVNATVVVHDEMQIEADVHVSQQEREQNEHKTHPAVCAEIRIGGRSAVLKAGVNPRFPVSLSLVALRAPVRLGQEVQLHLEMENHTGEDAEVTVLLPENPHCTFSSQDLRVTLTKGERRGVALPVRVKSHGVLDLRLPVYVSASGRIEFTRRATAVLPGHHACFGGLQQNSAIAAAGPVFAFQAMDSMWNAILLRHLAADAFDPIPSISAPQLGLPLSSEFTTTPPRRVWWEEDAAGITLFTEFVSDRSGAKVTSRLHLSPDRLVRLTYEVEGDPEQISHLKMSSGFDFSSGYYPYRDRVVRMEGTGEEEMGFGACEPGGFSGRWLWIDGARQPLAVFWDEGWEFSTTYDLIFQQKLEWHNGKAITTPITFALGTFRDWRELVSFLGSQAARLAETHTLLVNWGNPFVPTEFPIALADPRSHTGAFAVEVRAQGESFAPTKFSLPGEAALVLQRPAESERIEIMIETDRALMETRQRIFPVGAGTVSLRTEDRAGRKVSVADNGVLAIAAGGDGFPALVSCRHNGHEWLASSFPEPRAFQWWNPWFGGIHLNTFLFRTENLRTEHSTVEFVSILDCFGETWQGLEIQVDFAKYRPLQGLKLCHRFLMRPGVPVLCEDIEILQDSGRFLNRAHWASEAYLAASPGSFLEVRRNLAHGGRTTYRQRELCNREKFFDAPTVTDHATGRSVLTLQPGQDRRYEVVMNREFCVVASELCAEMPSGIRFRPPPCLRVFSQTPDLEIGELQALMEFSIQGEVRR